MNLISKKDAIKLELKFYFTGNPCPHGHISQRYVSSNTCEECEKTRRSKRTKEASAISWKKWHIKNKQKHDEYNKNYKNQNSDYYKNYKKKYYEANKERLKKQSLKSCHKRNAIKKKSGGCFSFTQIEEMLKKQKLKCVNCKTKLTKYHIDHIMPLSKGGSNDIKNIQLLCPKCNLKKSAKLPIVWAFENGRLL